MIRHTVTFRLKHPPGSAAERDFLQAACALATIPGVERFECLRQTSGKNNFTFGLSMEFADVAAYATAITPTTPPLSSSAGFLRWLSSSNSTTRRTILAKH